MYVVFISAGKLLLQARRYEQNLKYCSLTLQ